VPQGLPNVAQEGFEVANHVVGQNDAPNVAEPVPDIQVRQEEEEEEEEDSDDDEEDEDEDDGQIYDGDEGMDDSEDDETDYASDGKKFLLSQLEKSRGFWDEE